MTPNEAAVEALRNEPLDTDLEVYEGRMAQAAVIAWLEAYKQRAIEAVDGRGWHLDGQDECEAMLKEARGDE